MISFLQYLKESIETKINDKKKLRSDIKKILLTDTDFAELIENNKPVFKNNEILRMGFGKDYNKAKQIVQSILNKLNIDVKLNQDPESYSIKSREDASGTFKSFEVEYNDNIFYITNKDSAKGNFKNKELVPNKLDLTQNKSFANVDNMINTIIKSQTFSKSSPYINFLKDSILNKFKSNNFSKNKITKTGCFKKSNLDEVFNVSTSDEKSGTITLNNIIEKNILTKNNISKEDINTILKDFGEVIGPLIFLNLFNDAKVLYPDESNARLIDYYIISPTNKYKISAKANGGAKPSGVSIFNNEKLNEILNDDSKFNNLILKKIDNKDKDIISKNEKNIKPAEIKEFIKFLIENFKKPVFDFQYNLIKEYAFPNLNKTNEIKELEKNLFKQNTNTKNSFLTILNNFFDNKKIFKDKESIIKFFKKFYTTLKYNPSKQYGYTFIENNFEICKEETKIGLIFYPLYKFAINFINEKYCNKEVNILSKIINNTIDIKQVYLSIKGSDLLLDMRFSNYSDWEFAVSNLSVGNIFNQRPAIKLLK